MGKARFTVLTPQMIRLEWASDGKFEDRASFVFLNRKLALVPFERAETEHGHKLTIKTSALTLIYTPGAGLRSHQDGRFTPENLTIELTLDGKAVKWHPGLSDDQNLMGTTRTLDGAVGEKTKEPIEEGLISRSGWAVVDDSSRPLFDSADFSFKDGQNSPWPWVMERPAGDRQDWYFFGYGHDYRKALGDYIKVAGRIPLPPKFAFGTWWSRYWDYSDQEIEEIVRGFHENNVPLDVFVIDMGWHISREQLQARGEKDQAASRSAGPDSRGTSSSSPSLNCFSTSCTPTISKPASICIPLPASSRGKMRIPRWRAPWASIRRRAGMFRSTCRIRNSPRIT